jgi:hypothetical protein
MKHFKMLSLAVVAAAALMAMAAAGTASATVLCKTTTTPCSSVYGKGTVIRPVLTGSNVLETLDGSTILNTCVGTSIKTVIENPGGATATVFGPNQELVPTGCTNQTFTVKAGSIEIHHIAGTDNGTVTGLVAEVTVVMFGTSCTYGAGTGTDIGTLFGGEAPVIKVNGVVKKTAGGFLCPAETRWTGEYKVTEPTPLYVEPS